MTFPLWLPDFAELGNSWARIGASADSQDVVEGAEVRTGGEGGKERRTGSEPPWGLKVLRITASQVGGIFRHDIEHGLANSFHLVWGLLWRAVLRILRLCPSSVENSTMLRKIWGLCPTSVGTSAVVD